MADLDRWAPDGPRGDEPAAVVRWIDAHGGPVVQIVTPAAVATVAPRGGQVVAWRPAGHAAVLWCSPLGRLDEARPLRGGIPICWPWFGAHPDDPTAPPHGYARTATWRLIEAAWLKGPVGGGDEPGAVRLVLALQPPAGQDLPGTLRLQITIGADLHLELETVNTGTTPLRLTEALHTYLAVSDVAQIRIEGLDGLAYLDKPAGYARMIQRGPVTFAGEVDRIYLGATTVQVVDPGLDRRIEIDSEATSRSTVVWNPGSTVAARLADVPPGGHGQFVCVESAHAADDAVMLPPGGSSRLVTRIRVAAM